MTNHTSGQILTTKPPREFPQNVVIAREYPENAPNSGLGIKAICPDKLLSPNEEPSPKSRTAVEGLTYKLKEMPIFFEGAFQSLETSKNPGRFPHVHQEVRVNTYWILVAYYSKLSHMFQMTHLFGQISSPSDLKWEIVIFDLKSSHPPFIV